MPGRLLGCCALSDQTVHSRRSFFALAAVALCWGYSWVFNKLALLDAGPLSFSAYRMLLAAAALVSLLKITGRPVWPARVPELLLLGLIQTTGFVSLSMWALVTGAVGTTSILVFTMPFWTLLFAWPMLGERIEGLQWLAVVSAALGLTIILHPWHLEGSLNSKLLALGAAILWAAGSIIVKRMQAKAPVELLSLTAWQITFGAIPLAGIAWLAGEPPIHWTPRFIGVLLGTSLISTALGWLIWLYALRRVTAGIAGMSMLAVPVIAGLSSAWHFHERPTTDEARGMILIGVALVLVGIHAWRRHRDVTPLAQE